MSNDSQPPFGLIFAQLDVPQAVEDELNDWYDTEHIRERLGMNGFRTARRAERAQPAPKYIALYDLDSLAVLDGAEYKGKSGEARTPWTARMLKLTRTFDRRLYEQVVPGREEVAMQPFTVLRFVPHDANVDVRAHVEKLRRDGIAARLYDGRERAKGEHLVLCTVADEESAHALPPLPGRTDIYGPYSRPPDATRFVSRVL